MLIESILKRLALVAQTQRWFPTALEPVWAVEGLARKAYSPGGIFPRAM
jgi:hypothetical protein